MREAGGEAFLAGPGSSSNEGKSTTCGTVGRELSLSVGGERSLDPVWEERITFCEIAAKSSDANVYLRSRDIASFSVRW